MPVLDPAARAASCLDLYRRLPLFADLGIDSPELAEDSCTQRWAFGPEHMGMNGTLHGGMTCVLADSLAAFVVCMALGIPQMTTTDLQVQYLRPIASPVTATGRLIKGGRTFATVSVELAGPDGQLGALVILKLLLMP